MTKIYKVNMVDKIGDDFEKNDGFLATITQIRVGLVTIKRSLICLCYIFKYSDKVYPKASAICPDLLFDHCAVF
jgi:hypothetical protein